MTSRAVTALVLSVAGVWLASSSADWRYIPWGNLTAGPFFAVGAVEVLIGGAILAASLERIGAGFPALLWHALGVGICLAAEFFFWALAAEDHAIFGRQGVGLLLSPLLLAAGAYLIRGHTTFRDLRLRSAMPYALGVAVLGLALFASLFVIRQAPFNETGVYGAAYEMLQTMLFATLVVTAVSFLAAIVALIRSHRRRQLG